MKNDTSPTTPEMGANYNTTLLPTVEQPKIIAAIENALQQFGCHIVFSEEPTTYEDGFHHVSVNMIFYGPPGERWVPISTCSSGLGYAFPQGYRADPFSIALSKSLSPVVLLFSNNSGYVASYSIFSEGRQVEAHSLCWDPETPLREFAPPLDPPEPPTVLGGLLLDPDFDFEEFARGFASLEVAVAALAARLGVREQLLEALDIQDGDGAIVIEDGEYRSVPLDGWNALYYERIPEPGVTVGH